MTSSKISSAPLASQSARSPSRKPGRGKQPGRVVRDRLDDDRRDLVGVPLERRAHVVEVVVAADERGVDRRVEHARRVRVAPARRPPAAEHVAQHVVVKAVVTALELDDQLRAP